jgi:hypothetical protein
MEDTETVTPWLNGQVTGERRLRFGEKPHQTMPEEWAEPFMRYMFAHHPQMFGRVMLAVVGIEDTPRPGRRRTDG